VTGTAAEPKPVGESVYRLLLQKEDLLASHHPLVASGDIPDGCIVVKGPERKLVAYPIRGGTLLNVICYVRTSIPLHPFPPWMVPIHSVRSRSTIE
jgi:hypothetical protein